VTTSQTAVSTTSTSLQDDTQASQTINLSKSQVVLVIYQANSDYNQSMYYYGMANAISVDGNDYAQSWDSPAANNIPARNCVFWIGTLGSGSHTIKGRFASKSSGQTVTINNRVLLILILNGTEFQYIDDTTTRTTTSTSLTDDLSASVAFTPSGSCKALVMYNASNSGSTEYVLGKMVAVNIAGADYGQIEKAPDGTNYPDSVFTVHGIALTAVSTAVKGRFASFASSTVTIHRRQLGVLLFSDDTLMDVVTSTTQVSTTSSSLVDDGQATINRTTTDDRTVLVVAAGTKRNGTSTNVNGECYGIKVDTNDRAKSRGSPSSAGYPNSAATAWAESLSAASHTIQGRFSNNYSTNSAKIDARQVVALWISSTIQVNVTDTGAGSDTPSMTATVPYTDTGAGADAVPTLQGQIPATDSGLGTEAGVAVVFMIPDAGSGADAPGLTAQISYTDLVVGADIISIYYDITVGDAAAGSELWTGTYTIPVSDAAVGTELYYRGLNFYDYGLAAEFAWRIKPSGPMIDDFSLPHVQALTVTDPAVMVDKKIQGGALPRRKMVGKPGRVVQITGWTDQQSDIDTMEALADGTPRIFYHPDGDSFTVLVTKFDPDRKAEDHDHRTYIMTLEESR
jgi:hypothetical protein